MMLYPAMGELSSHIHNRYMLVNVVSRRARQIAEAYENAHQILEEKPVTIAINEVANGILDPDKILPAEADADSPPESAEVVETPESAEASENVESSAPEATETADAVEASESTETVETSEVADTDAEKIA